MNTVFHSRPDTNKTVLAVIDIGGNSISVEFRWANKPHKKSKKLPEKYKSFCALAQSIGRTGSIDDEAKACAINTLDKIGKIIDATRQNHGNIDLQVIGTAPFRDAENGAEFAQEIRSKTGLPLRVISGDEEAMYAAHGVLSYFPDISGVVVDVGGGSAEFAVIENGEIKKTQSLSLGMLRIAAHETKEDAQNFIKELLNDLPEEFLKPDNLILTGGINREETKMYARLHRINLKKASLDDCAVSSDDFIAFSRVLANANTEDLTDAFLMQAHRAPQAKHIHLLLSALQEKTNANTIVLNKATTRDGIRAEMIEKSQYRATYSMKEQPITPMLSV